MLPERRVPDELSEGPRFAAFCEAYLRHTKGRWARRPIVWEDWQRAFWWEALELDPATGLRIYSEIGLGLPRKNGKSTKASAFGIYSLVADGENEPEVYVGAGAQQQAGIVMGQSLRMGRASPLLYPRLISIGKYAMEGVRNGGIMRALSSDGALQHGLNPSATLIDEVHAHKDADLFVALTTGTGAREQPTTLWITTAGPDEDNLLRSLYGQMTEGPGELEIVSPYLRVYRDRENGVLIWWYGADRDADIEDPRVWTGVNPASWRTEEALRKDFVKLRGKGQLLEWQIYHLDMIVGAEDSWIPAGSWSALATDPKTDDPWDGLDETRPVGVGIEKAPSGAGGAIVVAQRTEDRVAVRVAHFRAEASGHVSVPAMRSELRRLFARFPTPALRDPKTRRQLPGPAFAFDPFTFQESAEELSADGLDMVTMGQTTGTMAPASTTTYELIATSRLSHDGDPILARHVLDSTAQLTERGMRIVKGTARANHSAIALVMAVAMAMIEPPKPFVRKTRAPMGF